MGGWPEGDKKEILSRLRASDCWLLVGKTVAATRLGRYSLHCSRLFRGQGCHILWEWGLLWGALSVAFKKKGGLKGLQNYVDLKAIQFHILTSWSQNKITRLADDGFIRDLVVNCVRERVNYLKYISVRQAQHLMWHVEGERVRERETGSIWWKLPIVRFSRNQFCFLWIRVCHLMRSSHSSLSVQTCPSNSIYWLQTRNPSEFCVNKSSRH